MTSHLPQPARKLIICTVGGTPDPIVKSLLHWQPERVLFVPSVETRAQVDEILRGYAKGAGQPLSPGCYELRPVENAQELRGCLEVIKTLDREVEEWLKRGDDYQVVADFTAGTKCMSAALALQARRWRCQFSYVGGARRTKGGVGVVESGSENVVHSDNPWDALGYQAVEDAVTVFNHGGYAVAADLLDAAMKKSGQQEVKRELATLKAVVDAYAAWDRFDHENAEKNFSEALKNRNNLKAIFAAPMDLIPRLERHRERVAHLARQKEPAKEWVEDLILNAGRRAGERRYDDAVARLYRACEALAQVRLREKHNLPDTKTVPLDRLPPELRREWEVRARDGQVSLGLQDAYALLKALKDELGDRFASSGLVDQKGSPLGARNQSILAHGFQPVGKKVYDQLRDKVRGLALLEKDDSHDWRLPIPR